MQAYLPWRLIPSGDDCLIVAFDAESAIAANHSVTAAAAMLMDARIPGVVDVVPAMTTVGVHYDARSLPVDASGSRYFDACAAIVDKLLQQGVSASAAHRREIEVPVCYGGDYGPDLDAVAATCGITASEVIALHTKEALDVFMLGFAPGHPYMGMLDPVLSLGRRATPRTQLAPGSVAIANRQSIIYPMTLPGGWNLIGRTPLQLFDPHRATPCLINAGDKVRFVSIDEGEFESLQKRSAT